MLKKIGLPMLALAGMLVFAAPPKADARVRFGIGIGGPVYTAPVPAYPYGYAAPYAYGPNYYAAPAPVYPYDYGYAPYAYPYYGGGVSFGFGGGHGYARGHDYGRGGGHYGGHRR